MFNQNNNVWQVLNNLPEYDIDDQEHLQSTTEQQTGDSNRTSEHRVIVGPTTHGLSIGSDVYHSSIPVLPSLLALIIIQIGLLAAVFTVPIFHDLLPESTNVFSVVQYLYIVCWAFITFLTWYIYGEFHQIWLLGYNNFFRTTQHLHGASFFVYTAGLVLMCVLGTVVRDYCAGGAINPCGKHLHLSPVNYQQMVVTLLTLVALLLTIKLVFDVYRFNQSELPADVLVDDLGVRLSQSTLYVGIGRPSTIHTVLEVQGSVISSLRNRVDILNRQIAVLANTLEGYLDSS